MFTVSTVREHLPLMSVIGSKYLKKFRSLLGLPLQNVMYYMKLNRNMLLRIQKERIFLQEFLFLLNLTAIIFHDYGRLVNVRSITKVASFHLIFLSEAQWITDFPFSLLETVVGAKREVYLAKGCLKWKGPARLQAAGTVSVIPFPCSQECKRLWKECAQSCKT